MCFGAGRQPAPVRGYVVVGSGLHPARDVHLTWLLVLIKQVPCQAARPCIAHSASLIFPPLGTPVTRNSHQRQKISPYGSRCTHFHLGKRVAS